LQLNRRTRHFSFSTSAKNKHGLSLVAIFWSRADCEKDDSDSADEIKLTEILRWLEGVIFGNEVKGWFADGDCRGHCRRKILTGIVGASRIQKRIFENLHSHKPYFLI
jgi:hypothetical protein